MKVETQNRARLRHSYEQLKRWLLTEVLPRWARQGVDAQGGFVEMLDLDGSALARPRRMRVQPRQIFAFAHAPELGWGGDVEPLLRGGLDYLVRHYQRSDGLFRTLIAADGSAIDERAQLYDHCFVLLAYAAAAKALNARVEFEARAIALRQLIERRLGAGDGTFFSDLEHRPTRESNPHMHLLEACLAWADIGHDPQWQSWGRSLVEIGLQRFVHKNGGFIGELYTETGLPAAGLAGRIIEPGHQFEWAWLLLRSGGIDSAAREAALRLIEVGEEYGVQQGFAVNALLDDFSVHDPASRFWPQTERLKAALLVTDLTGNPRYGSMACAAAESFFAYINPQTTGLWFDLRAADGQTLREAAPASTLYHLVGALLALHRSMATWN